MDKIKVTQRQRANLIDAMTNMWPSIPEANVSGGLDEWRENADSTTPPTCGSICCFGGWCEWWPSFRTQLGFDDKNEIIPWSKLVGLFGPFENPYIDGLFTPRPHHHADMGFEGNDHACVTNRLHWLLENSEVQA
jgi:hypothetical protein